MAVSDIAPRNMRGGRCMGDVMGAFKRASEAQRAFHQWNCPKVLGRKQRGKIAVSHNACSTTYLKGGKSYVNP